MRSWNELVTKKMARVKADVGELSAYAYRTSCRIQTFSKNWWLSARKHDILICHDNPYSFILNENPMSMLAVPGAKDVVIELNSLSKSQNMAGWRVGMLCGAKQTDR